MARFQQSSSEPLSQIFDRDLRRARKAASRKVGPRIRRAQQNKMASRLDNPSRKRLRQVRWQALRFGDLLLQDTSALSDLLERGGTIRPQSGQWLAVPIGGAKQIGSKKPANDFAEVRRRIEAAGGETFVRRLSDGQLYVFATRAGVSTRALRSSAQKMGRPAAKVTAIPVAVLKRSVRIPAILGFRETIRRFAPAYTREIQRQLEEQT